MPLLTRKRVRPTTINNQNESKLFDSIPLPSQQQQVIDCPVIVATGSRESLENDEPSLDSLNLQLSSQQQHSQSTLNKSQPFSISNQINICRNSQQKLNTNTETSMSSKRESEFKAPSRTKKLKNAQPSQLRESIENDEEMMVTTTTTSHSSSTVNSSVATTTSIEYSEPITSQDLRQLDEIGHNVDDDVNFDLDVNGESGMMFSDDIENQISESQLLDNTKSQVNSHLRNAVVNEAERAKFIFGEIGHIQEIILHNFMCHTKFQLELGPRINFILGPNGSGKSAILNGIVLGLGGRASNTNRGSGLATFIKTGQTKARVTIKLCNYSENEDHSSRYHPEKYGKSITIERNIYSTGAGSYKIRDEDGKVVSEKKDELDNILKHFSILIDNPICVLTQEVSKNFLNTKSAFDKFKFFVKATQLEDVKRDYETSYENKEHSQKLAKEKVETIQLFEKKLKEKEKKVKIIEILKDSVDRIEKLNLEAKWANINEKEVEMKKVEKLCQELNSKSEEQLAKIEEVNANSSELSAKKQEFVDKLKGLASETEKATSNYNQAKDSAREVRAKLTEKESNLRIIKKEMNADVREINDLKKRISAIEVEEESPIDFEAELESLKNQIESKRNDDIKYREEFKVLQERCDTLLQQKTKLNELDRNNMSQIASRNTQIENIVRGQKNRINIYGQKYSDLMAQIDIAFKKGQFKKRPYGPIGEYIRLQDKKAALAVESALKTFLYAFVVDNGQDSSVLSRIISSIRGLKRPTIIIRKYGPLHDVSDSQVRSPKYQNFLQLLNIQEPSVANCLIDHSRIEQILYIPDKKEALNVMGRQQNVPRNCHQAYNIDGDRLHPSTARTEFKCYMNTYLKSAKVLVHDYSYSISSIRKEVEQLNLMQSSNAEKINGLNQEIDKDKRMLAKVNEHINGLKVALIDLQKKHSVLQAKSKDVLSKPVEVMALREEVDKLIAGKEEYESQIASLTEERNVFLEQYKELETEVDLTFNAQKDIYNSRQPIRDQIEDISKEIMNKTKTIDGMTRIKDDILKKLTDLEAKLNQQKTDLDSSRHDALELGNGQVIETARKCSDILTDIKRIELIIKENQNIIGESHQKEIIDSYIQLKELVDRFHSDMEQLDDYIDLLSKSLMDRKEAYVKLRYYITLITNYYFEEVLSQKGFSGEIVVNFTDSVDETTGKTKKGKSLDIMIRPREEKQFFSQGGSQAEVRTIYSNTKSLSGGERSYSTVAFIIALWEICTSPFKVLDEVDVFMDMVTRKISIDTLIEFASLKSSKQYIFLSPLKIQNIHRPECIKIFQMPEIERN